MMKSIDAVDFRLQITPHPNFTTPSFCSIFSVYFDLNYNDLGSPTVGQPDDVGGPGAENGFSPDATATITWRLVLPRLLG